MMELETYGVTELSDEEEMATNGGYGLWWGVNYWAAFASAVLSNAETSLEGSGQVIGGGGA